MTILIDADGCPVVDLTVQTATKYKVPVLILCDTAHQIQRDGAQTLTFDKGPDSVDFALVNRVHPGDLVITQDYGLASICSDKSLSGPQAQSGIHSELNHICISETFFQLLALDKALRTIEDHKRAG